MFSRRVRQSGLIFFDFCDDGVDVALQRQGDDVGLEAVDHRPGLLAGAAMRGLHRHVLARLGLPMLRKGGVEILVEFSRGVVGDVEDRRLRKGHCERPDLDGTGHQASKQHAGEGFHVSHSGFPTTLNVTTRMMMRLKFDLGASAAIAF